MEVLYEAKAEVPVGSEGSTSRKLKLRFVGERNVVDHYLKTEDGKTTKLKRVDDGNNILYEFFFDGDCLSMTCTNMSNSAADRLLADSPPTTILNSRKRVYFWKEFGVNVEFTYIKQLEGEMFLEIADDSKQSVMDAKHYLEQSLGIRDFIATPFDELVKENE